jgi:hypothetical protein
MTFTLWLTIAAPHHRYDALVYLISLGFSAATLRAPLSSCLSALFVDREVRHGG